MRHGCVQAHDSDYVSVYVDDHVQVRDTYRSTADLANVNLGALLQLSPPPLPGGGLACLTWFAS
jgi:hypothetical protein